MIRLGYVVPRLALVAVVVFLAWAALNPLLRWGLIRSGQSLTGAKFEIGSLQTSMLGTHLELRDLEVADPHHEMRNLVQADRVRIDLDTGALLRKRLVVSEATVSGVRFDADRATSGKLDPIAPVDNASIRRRWSEFAEDWSPLIAATARDRLEEELEKLESVRLAGELRERWPAECDALLQRAKRLHERAEQIRSQAENPSDPLRAIRLVDQLTREIGAIRREVEAIAREARRLGTQAQSDTQAVVAAGERDVERLRERFDFEAFETANLSEYLLGRQLDHRVRDLVAWAEWTRKWMPSSPRAIEDYRAERGRGVDILFPGARKYPQLWVEHLGIDGTTTIGGRDYAFIGRITDLTTDQPLVGRPAVARFRMSGDTTYEAECSIDYSTDPPSERIVINCPDAELPPLSLGDEKHLAVDISPGRLHLWLEAELRGDRLTARILAKQVDVRMAPRLEALDGAGRLAERLAAALGEVDTIETVVLVSGTLEEPAWKLRSNLGPAVSRAMQSALEEELAARERELEQLARSRIDDELTELDAMFRAKFAEVDQLWQSVDGSVVDLSQGLLERLPPQNALRRALSNSIAPSRTNPL